MRRMLFAVLLGVVGCSSPPPPADENQIVVQMRLNTPATAEIRASEHCAAYGRVPKLVVAGADDYVFHCVPEGTE